MPVASRHASWDGSGADASALARMHVTNCLLGAVTRSGTTTQPRAMNPGGDTGMYTLTAGVPTAAFVCHTSVKLAGTAHRGVGGVAPALLPLVASVATELTRTTTTGDGRDIAPTTTTSPHAA